MAPQIPVTSVFIQQLVIANDKEVLMRHFTSCLFDSLFRPTTNKNICGEVDCIAKVCVNAKYLWILAVQHCVLTTENTWWVSGGHVEQVCVQHDFRLLENP